MFSRFARPSSIRTAVMRSATFRFCSGVRPSTQVICTCGIALPPNKSKSAFYRTWATDFSYSRLKTQAIVLLKGGGNRGRSSHRLTLRRDGARPDDFQGRFAPHQHLRALGDPNNQGIFAVRTKLAQTFFLGLQALIGSIQGNAQLVRSSGQEPFEGPRTGGRGGAQPGG